LVAISLAVLIAAVAWGVERWKREAALQGRMRREVIVTLKTGESFSGVMFERDAVVMVLRNAVDLQPNAPVPVDGELLVRWAEVAYVQLP
jgi:small nuclear ribonucleoprotein (snRNP)-like protein